MTKLKQLRTRCFFDVSIAQDSIGRIIFELYNDVCPKTCENFKALCTGERGIGKFTGKPLHYKDVLFHRVVKNFMIQSGDFSQGNGKGGESIYGGTFEDESFDFKHDEAFLLSMANRGKNTNGSQFFITLAPAPHLDGVHVVFGHVIAGQDVVTKIANQAVDKNARPFVEVRISNCGELIPQIKSKDVKKKKESKRSKRSDSEESSNDSSDSDSSSDSGSDSSSDNESSRRKKDAASEKNENEAQRGSTKNGQVAIPISDLPNAPKVYANIKADEIPDVPPNRFLARNFKPKETTKEENGDSERPTDRRREGRREYSHRVSYSRSGRKVKGRGFLRYRTPSPDHDRDRFRRSETPPHWKSAQARLKSLKEVITPTTATPREAEHKNGQEKPRRRPSYEDRPRSSRHRRSRSRSTSRDRQRSRRNESSRRRSSSRSPDRDRRRKRSRSSSRESNHAKEAKESLESAKRQLSAPKRPLEVRDEYEE